MIGSDRAVVPSPSEQRLETDFAKAATSEASAQSPIQQPLHLTVHLGAVQGIGDNNSIVNSHLKLEQNLLKLAKGAHVYGGIHIKVSGKYPLPTKVNNLPEAVSGHLERVFKLEEMTDKLATQSKDIKELMLVGLTGSGKTELARAYAKRYEVALTQAQGVAEPLSSASSSTSSSATSQINVSESQDKRSLIYLIHADVDNYLSGFESLAELLIGEEVVTELRNRNNIGTSSEKLHAYEQVLGEKISESLKYYPGWLLILDGIANVQTRMTYLNRLIPKKALVGTILYTSQDTRTVLPEAEVNPNDPVYVVPWMDVSLGLTDNEAITLLEQLTGIKEGDKDLVLALAIGLDKLPLALQAAGRHIAQQRKNNPAHRDAYGYAWYKEQHEQAVERLTKNQEAFCQAWGIAHTQYVAVNLSIQNLAQPAAQELLDICSLLCEHGLPEALLRTYTSDFLKQDFEAAIEADVAIAGLRERGLLNIESLTQHTYYLHQITHKCARLALEARMASDNEAVRVAFAERLLSLFDRPGYDMPEKFAYLRQLYPHVVTFINSLYLLENDVLVSKVRDFLLHWCTRANALGYPTQVITWTEHNSMLYQSPTVEEVNKLIQCSIANSALGLHSNEIDNLIKALSILGELKNNSVDVLSLTMDVYMHLVTAYGKAKGEKAQLMYLKLAFELLMDNRKENYINFIMLYRIVINIMGGGLSIQFPDYATAKLVFDLLMMPENGFNDYEHNRLRLTLSQDYLRRGCIEDAENLVNAALTYFKDNPKGMYIIDYYNALLILGQTLGERGRPHEQIGAQEQALTFQGTYCPGDYHGRINILLALVNAYTDLRNTKKAKILLLNELRPLLIEHPNEVEIAYLYALLGRVYVYDGDFEQAEYYLLASEAIQQHTTFEAREAIHVMTQIYLGIVEFEKNDKDKSKQRLTNALMLDETRCYQKTRMKAMALFYMAKIHYQERNYEAAVADAKEAKEIFEKTIPPINKNTPHPWVINLIQFVNLLQDERTDEHFSCIKRANILEIDLSALSVPGLLDGGINGNLYGESNSAENATSVESTLQVSDAQETDSNNHLCAPSCSQSMESLTVEPDISQVLQDESISPPNDETVVNTVVETLRKWRSPLLWALGIGATLCAVGAIVGPALAVTLPAAAAEAAAAEAAAAAATAAAGAQSWGAIGGLVVGAYDLLAAGGNLLATIVGSTAGSAGTAQGLTALAIKFCLGDSKETKEMMKKLKQLAYAVGIELDDKYSFTSWRSVRPGSFVNSLFEPLVQPVLSKTYAHTCSVYTKQRDIELSFEQGQQFWMIKEHHDGWWLCQSIATLDIGLIQRRDLLIDEPLVDIQIQHAATSSGGQQEDVLRLAATSRLSGQSSALFFKPNQSDTAPLVLVQEASSSQHMAMVSKDYGQYLRVSKHADIRNNTTYEFELINLDTLTEKNIDELKQIMQWAFSHQREDTKSNDFITRLFLAEKSVASHLLNSLCEYFSVDVARQLPGEEMIDDSPGSSSHVSSSGFPSLTG